MIFLVVGIITGAVISDRTGHAKYAAYNSYSTEEYIKSTCGVREGEALAECVHNAIQASRNDQRSERDVTYQGWMAYATWWVLVVSAFMLIATAFGVFFVWRTLCETRTVTEVTRKIGEDQSRAYLLATGARIYEGLDGIVVTLKNTGQTPVRYYSVRHWVFRKPKVPKNWYSDFSGSSHWLDGQWSAIGSQTEGLVLCEMPANVSKSLIGEGPPSEVICIKGIVEYETILSERFETYFVFNCHAPISFTNKEACHFDETRKRHYIAFDHPDTGPLPTFRKITDKAKGGNQNRE